MIEEYFRYYCLMKSCDVLHTIIENELTIEEIYSALYGEFIREGKPKLEGYDEFKKLCEELVKAIIKKVKTKHETKQTKISV